MSRGCPELPCRPKGGLREAAFIAAEAVVSVEYDAGGGVCTLLRLKPGAEAVAYPLSEDRSLYEESVEERRGFRVVKHSLGLVRDGLSHEQTHPLEEVSGGGCLILLSFNCGSRALVGASKRMGLSQPLRLVEAKRNRGKKPSDGIAEELLFESFDLSVAACLDSSVEIPVAARTGCESCPVNL